MDRKCLTRFRSENVVFKFLQRSVDRGGGRGGGVSVKCWNKASVRSFKITEGQVVVVVHDVYCVNTCTPSDLNFQTMHTISDRGLFLIFFFKSSLTSIIALPITFPILLSLDGTFKKKKFKCLIGEFCEGVVVNARKKGHFHVDHHERTDLLIGVALLKLLHK